MCLFIRFLKTINFLILWTIHLVRPSFSFFLNDNLFIKRIFRSCKMFVRSKERYPSLPKAGCTEHIQSIPDKMGQNTKRTCHFDSSGNSSALVGPETIFNFYLFRNYPTVSTTCSSSWPASISSSSYLQSSTTALLEVTLILF